MDPLYRSMREELNHLMEQWQFILNQEANAHAANTPVAEEKQTEPMAHILFRGEYHKRRQQVKPNTPKVLPALPDHLPRNRLGLAQWLFLEDHPLTSRVAVNRFWQDIFGAGIVSTPSDFGVAGELPSHPQLLDWLAADFRDSGWDVKRFFKTVVTSSTYRQAAVITAEHLEKDPHNRLLARAARYRLDAEVIRDYALAASGLLVRKVGGPVVHPYQPEGIWEAMAIPDSNTNKYVADQGDKLYRRSLYTFWKRMAPPPSMEIFNAPTRMFCVLRRDRTNTPLQALVTLNDPQFVEAARFLAQNALLHGGATVEQRLDYLARRLLARPFRAEELVVIKDNLTGLLEHYQSHPGDARQLLAVGATRADASRNPALLAAWTMLGNELLNLDEVLNK